MSAGAKTPGTGRTGQSRLAHIVAKSLRMLRKKVVSQPARLILWRESSWMCHAGGRRVRGDVERRCCRDRYRPRGCCAPCHIHLIVPERSYRPRLLGLARSALRPRHRRARRSQAVLLRRESWRRPLVILWRRHQGKGRYYRVSCAEYGTSMPSWESYVRWRTLARA